MDASVPGLIMFRMFTWKPGSWVLIIRCSFMTTAHYNELRAVKTQQCEDTQPGLTNWQTLTAKNNMAEDRRCSLRTWLEYWTTPTLVASRPTSSVSRMSIMNFLMVSNSCGLTLRELSMRKTRSTGPDLHFWSGPGRRNENICGDWAKNGNSHLGFWTGVEK